VSIIRGMVVAHVTDGDGVCPRKEGPSPDFGLGMKPLPRLSDRLLDRPFHPLYHPSVELYCTRQDGRNTAKSIFTVPENKQAILRLVNRIVRSGMKFEPKYTFGNGNSTTKIMQILNSEKVWELPLQKRFEDTCVGQGRPISPVGIPAISKIQDADILRQSEYVLEKV
jgi:hypothetical protein